MKAIIKKKKERWVLLLLPALTFILLISHKRERKFPRNITKITTSKLYGNKKMINKPLCHHRRNSGDKASCTTLSYTNPMEENHRRLDE